MKLGRLLVILCFKSFKREANNLSKDNLNDEQGMSRRKFIERSGYVVGGLVGGSLIGGFLVNQNKSSSNDTYDTSSESEKEVSSRQDALMYFTSQEDFEVIKKATERIFPGDENAPGAIDLHVPLYIDHQLAGNWGANVRDYMQGPHYDVTSTDYQTRLKRSEIFDLGIDAIKEYSQTAYDKKFLDLDEEEQDEILMKLQENEIELRGVSSGLFFELLRSATIEGVYCDPVYGGNNNMDGWRLKEFPGNQMSYRDQIESDEFFEIEPKSLSNLANVSPSQ